MCVFGGGGDSFKNKQELQSACSECKASSCSVSPDANADPILII